MKVHAHVLVSVAAALALGTVLLANAGGGDDEKSPVWKPVLPEEEYKELVARSRSMIQRELSDLNPQAAEFKKRLRKVRNQAVFLAAYAQSGPKAATDPAAAALRNAALALAEKTGEKLDLAAAKRFADALADPKADPSLKPGLVPLRTALMDREDIMFAFKTRMHGGDGIDPILQSNPSLRLKSGDGIEKKVQALAEDLLKPAELKKQAEELALMAYKTAAIAQLAQDWTPNVKEEGKKGPKDWLQRSQDMRKFALELAEVAGKGDPQQLRAVARKLDATCDGCHKIYK